MRKRCDALAQSVRGKWANDIQPVVRLFLWRSEVVMRSDARNERQLEAGSTLHTWVDK